MRQHGDMNGGQRVAEVAAEPGGAVAQLAAAVADERGELRAAVDLRRVAPAGAGGVEPAVVQRVVRGCPLRREALIMARLVARRKQDERRMIAVGGEDARGFVLQKLPRHRAVKIRPQAAFGLEVKAQFIRGFKRGFRWTPGVESHAVQPVILAGLENLLPRHDVHRRITGEREIASEMREPQVDWAAVDENVLIAGGDFAEAEGIGNF